MILHRLFPLRFRPAALLLKMSHHCLHHENMSSISSLATVIDKVVESAENEHKSYMLREDEGPSAEEIDMFSKRIVLTELEKSIISLLNECKATIDNNTAPMPPAPSAVYEHHRFTKGSTLNYLQPMISPETVTLRFAGGWVRDKLLGIHSSDIDVSIDSMTGERFASIFHNFIQRKNLPISSVAVVAMRPDQSKHLETACLSLFGQKIDFVNLRSEMYSETSRIPTRIVFGSPSDDAHRRDITINALFYNIHTQKVEDWTGRGLKDLANGLVRTPLPPASIFMDDPLRILRVIRFASRFNFKIDPEITESLLNNSRIRTLLSEKISRERIGIEVKKMLSGNNPFLSLFMIWNLKIWPCVFWHSMFITNLYERLPNFSISKYEHQVVHKGWVYSQILNLLLNKLPAFHSFPPAEPDKNLDPRQLGCSRITLPFHPEMVFLLFLCAAFLPHRGFLALKSSTDKSSKIPVSSFLCKYALKITNIEDEHVTSTIENHHHFIDLLDATNWKDPSSIGFERLYACLKLVGPRWEMSWIVSQIIAIERFISLEHHANLDFSLDMISEAVVEKVCKTFSELHKRIIELGLQNLWTVKPILNGNQVIQLLSFPKGNAHVHRLLCELVAWQIKNNVLESSPHNIQLASSYLRALYNERQDLFSSPTYPIKDF